ncbi:MAG: hypothetical protein LIP10_09520 [Clostridiales bacterium]|nr:hypothetical protein [Clostridiales bacterium]
MKQFTLFPIDFVFIALIIIWVVGLGAAISLKMKFPKPKKPEENESDVRYIAEKARNSWLIVSWVWQSMYYLMIIGSLLCTIIVLYVSCYMDINNDGVVGRIFIYSAFSIVFGMVPYMVDIKKISSAFHAAHRLANESLLTGDGIAEALIKGEELIRESFDGANIMVKPSDDSKGKRE